MKFGCVLDGWLAGPWWFPLCWFYSTLRHNPSTGEASGINYKIPFAYSIVINASLHSWLNEWPEGSPLLLSTWVDIINTES